MAENRTIARPYAQAAYACAKENGCVESWQVMLEAMALACSDEVFLSYLKNASSPQSAAQALCKLLSEGKENLLNDYGENFIALLSENARFEVIPDIFREFMRLKEEDQKIVEAEVTSARPLSETQLQALSKKIAARCGCQARIVTRIDKSLIGGAVLKIGDEVIDASVRTSLQDLSASLR